jgi:hypothetical protein
LTAAAIIRKAAREGVKLTVTSATTIKALGESRAIARWLSILRDHKREIVDFLIVRSSNCLANSQWSAEEWRAFYDEGAAMAEFDGGLLRAEAEAQAIGSCVAQWLNRNPVHSPPGNCFHCDRSDHGHDPLLPFGVEPTSHVWLHSRCWPFWHAGRKAEAIAALARMGIVGPADRAADHFELQNRIDAR